MSSGYTYQFESETFINVRPEKAFAFLADACTSPMLDPPWLKPQLLSSTLAPASSGSEIEYIYRWFEIPFYLRMIVTEHSPPMRLVRTQAQGPWQSFVHSSLLRPLAGGTVVSEVLRYRAAPDLFDRLFHRLVVQRQLRGVIAFRKRALIERFGCDTLAEQQNVS